MWHKRGLIYHTPGNHEWNKTHAQVPVVDVLNDRLRIYFATRNAHGKSNISYVEVDKNNPSNIVGNADRTLLEFGRPGTFDDSGMMPSSIVTIDNRKYLYYVGWTTRNTVPYQNAVGLVYSDDGGLTFSRYSEGPVISVNHVEPWFSGTAYVTREGSLFRMWYLSCIGWEPVDGKPEPLYNIKYAESPDGINWQQTGHVAIGLEGDEGGLVSAAVVKRNGMYSMWYGKRKKSDYRHNFSNTYRIGYAESADGKKWTRKDNLAGIDVSSEGWDSEMISYPYLVTVGDKLLMFYNGNGFGRSGFGYAVWED